MRMKNIALVLSASLLAPLGCLAMDFDAAEGTTNYLGAQTRSVTLRYRGEAVYDGICGVDRTKGSTMSLRSEPNTNLLVITDDEEHVITYYSSPRSENWNDAHKIFEFTVPRRASEEKKEN